MFKKMKLAVALKRVSMDLKVMGVGMAPIPWHHMLTTWLDYSPAIRH